MSHEIVYRLAPIRVDLQRALTAMRTFDPGMVVDDWQGFRHEGNGWLGFVEAGASNCTDLTGRLDRSWVLSYTTANAMDRVIQMARYAERELVKVRGKSISAENFIKLHRKAFAEAPELGTVANAHDLFFRIEPEVLVAKTGSQRKPAADDHPFTPWVLRSGLLSAGTNEDDAWTLRVDMSDRVLRTALIGWAQVVCHSYQDDPLFTLQREQRRVLNPWLDAVLTGNTLRRKVLA